MWIYAECRKEYVGMYICYLCSDEGLMLETSANTLFTAFSIYPHQPYVDILYVLLPRWYRPKLVLTGTSIPFCLICIRSSARFLWCYYWRVLPLFQVISSAVWSKLWKGWWWPMMEQCATLTTSWYSWGMVRTEWTVQQLSSSTCWPWSLQTLHLWRNFALIAQMRGKIKRVLLVVNMSGSDMMCIW